jgi:hypothetical protein
MVETAAVAPLGHRRSRTRADVPARRFVVGCSLLAGAAVLAFVASFLPWFIASDEPGPDGRVGICSRRSACRSRAPF